MVKKAERQAKALVRQAQREQYEREEVAMEAFLVECRACLPVDTWDKEFADAERCAGSTFHVVERMVSVLAATQQLITLRLRQALDAMLEALAIDRATTRWEALRYLNYGDYWKSQYGY